MREKYNINAEQLTEVKAGHTGYGLLIEHDGHITSKKETIQQIKEDIDNGNRFVIPDNFIVSAVFQKYGIKNANGRVYPENILKKEVQKYLENQVANHTAVGALDHPQALTLSGHDVSHRILDLRWEGHTLVGEMKLHLSNGFKRHGICSTSGDLVASMLLDGIQIGVSSRGAGGVEEKMGILWVNDYELLAFDTVLEPSTNNAWVKQNPDDLKPFIECSQINKEKEMVAEKINRIKKILL